MKDVDVLMFFNFRSPYCYLLSRTLFDRLAEYDISLQWYALAGWDGRSAPERAKVKVPLTRQDVQRWCRRMDIPFMPPPISTDPTPAAIVSLLAQQNDLLAPYVKNVMWAEWAEGRDIGETEVLLEIGEVSGLKTTEIDAALNDNSRRETLDQNWQHAQSLGVIGVPSFVIGEEVFWGNDRFDFVLEHLDELGSRLAK